MKKLIAKIIVLVIFLIPGITSGVGIENLTEGVHYVPNEVIIKIKDNAKNQKIGLFGREDKKTSVLDKISEKYNVSAKKSFAEIGKSKKISTFSINNNYPFQNHYKLTFSNDTNLEEVISDLNNNIEIEYAHLNYIAQLYEVVTPDDPGFVWQWGLNKIKAPNAWNINKGSEDIIIAVVDTGIDYDHEDLQYNMWTDDNGKYGYDFADNDNNPMDIPAGIKGSGHGTHVAGIISAVTDNNKGVAGVSWNSKLMAVKIFKNNGNGAAVPEIAEAIRYATENGAHIISNSWGYEDNDNNPLPLPSAIVTAINEANINGSLVVFAAGNGDKEVENSSVINSYENVITVAATNSSDKKAYFSNYGEWINVSAPGGTGTVLEEERGIYSTILNDKYGDKIGTSMAAPFVSGLAALIWSQDNSLSREDIWNIIVNTADDIDEFNLEDEFNPGYEGKLGSGRINAYKALKEFVSRVNFKVQNEEEDNIIGVEISIYEDENKEILFQKLITNEDGEVFIYLTDGNYWFTAIKDNYYVYEDNFTVNRETVDINLVMQETFFEIDDFSEQFQNKKAGGLYDNVNITFRKNRESSVDDVNLSLLIKGRNQDTPIKEGIKENVSLIPDDNMVEFELDLTITIADIYDVVFTISADEIEGTTRAETFIISSAEANSFTVSSDEIEINSPLVIEINDAKDVHDNLLNGEYTVNIVIKNSDDEAVFSDGNLVLLFTDGEAEYIIEDGMVEDGEYTIITIIDDIEMIIIITVVPRTYTVTFSEQNSLSGVQINVYSNNTRTNAVGSSKETNSLGQAIKELQDGNYWFTASKSGYNNYNGDFTVNGDSKTVALTLTQAGGGGGGGGGSRPREDTPPPVTETEKEETILTATGDGSALLSIDEYKKQEKNLSSKVTELKKNKERIKKMQERVRNILTFIKGHKNEEGIKKLIADILKEAKNIEDKVNDDLKKKENELTATKKIINKINQKEKLNKMQIRLIGFIEVLKYDSSKKAAKEALEMLLEDVTKIKKELEASF